MHQYETLTDEDMAVEFYPTCRNSLSVVRFATKPELVHRKETKAVSIQSKVALEDASTNIADASTPNNYFKVCGNTVENRETR